MPASLAGGFMNTQQRKNRCIALCTGDNENTSICWTLFTHFTGFDSPIEPLRAPADEIGVAGSG